MRSKLSIKTAVGQSFGFINVNFEQISLIKQLFYGWLGTCNVGDKRNIW